MVEIKSKPVIRSAFSRKSLYITPQQFSDINTSYYILQTQFVHSSGQGERKTFHQGTKSPPRQTALLFSAHSSSCDDALWVSLLPRHRSKSVLAPLHRQNQPTISFFFFFSSGIWESLAYIGKKSRFDPYC